MLVSIQKRGRYNQWLTVTEQQATTLDKLSYQLEVTRPVWLPYTDIAHDLVASLVDQLGCHDNKIRQRLYLQVFHFLLIKRHKTNRSHHT